MNQNLTRSIPSPRALSGLIKFRKIEWNGRKRRLTRANTVWDLREIAKKRTPRGPFDYTDGGSEQEISLNRSRETFRNVEFQPRILQDVSKLSTEVKVLDETFSLPFGIAPTGFTRMMHAEGELAGPALLRNLEFRSRSQPLALHQSRTLLQLHRKVETGSSSICGRIEKLPCDWLIEQKLPA